MQCSLDSGLVVVVFIVGCLLWVVGLLLFYEFEDVCDKIRFRANDSNMGYAYCQQQAYEKDPIPK